MDFWSRLDGVLIEQRSFVLGLICMLAAVVMRKYGSVKPEDCISLSKVTFSLCLPSLLFSKVYKAKINSSLGPVALLSFGVHVIQIILTRLIAHLVPNHRGSRGQWLLCMCGGNIGFAYPLIMAKQSLFDRVYPSFLLWHFAGNQPTVYIYDHIVAMVFAPSPKDKSPSSANVDQSLASHGEGTELEKVAPGKQSLTSASFAPSVDIGMPAAVLVAEQEDWGDDTDNFMGAFSLRAAFVRIAANPPFAAEVVGLIVNLCGLTLPASIDGLLETVGAPFSVLFFFMLGMNLIWGKIKPQFVRVFIIALGRLLMGGLLALIIMIPGLVPSSDMQTGALIAIFCPVAGVSMKYVLDFGYDRSMHAVMMTISNIFSLCALFVVIQFA